MFFCDQAPMFAFAPTYRYPRYHSPCSPCAAPSFLFMLPLLFLAGPIVSLLVLLAFKAISFFAPLVFLMLAFKMAFACHDDKPANFRSACYSSSAEASVTEVKSTASAKPAKEKPSEEADKNENAYEIHAAAPGVRPHDVTATLDHANVLRVSGKSASLSGGRVASVDRSIALPSDADVERIKISVSDGLVRVTIGKKAPRVLRVLPTSSGPTIAPAAAAPAASANAPRAEAAETAHASGSASDEGRAIPLGKPGAAGEADDDDEAGFVEVSQEEKKEQ